MSSSKAWTPPPGKAWTLGDGVGLVSALVAIAFIPVNGDSLTLPKMMVLVGGGLALLPFAIHRLRRRISDKGSRVVIVPVFLAALLAAWALISAIGSGAPWPNSIFGWAGRGDGLLSLWGAIALFLAASTLSSPEVRRASTWLLGGATVVVLIGWVQAAGVQIAQTGTGVVGLSGNPNFMAGYLAIMVPLGIVRALSPGHVPLRVWGGALALSAFILAYLTASLQGPVAAVIAAAVVGLSLGMMIGTRAKLLWRWVAVGAFVAGVALVAWSLVGDGPLRFLFSERTFAIRQQYWETAWRMMNGLPLFGSGPDGFARYVSEYRDESYIELLGPVLRVSAAHNLALQFGATLGWVGFILWIGVFGGVAALVVWRLFSWTGQRNLWFAGLAGALAAYLVQGLVSIDMLPLLATGWAVAGLALAGCVSPRTAPELASPVDKTNRKRGRAQAPSETPTQPSLAIASGALALAGVTVVGVQMAHVTSLPGISTQEEALAAVTSPWTPCQQRNGLLESIINQLPAEVAVPAVYDAVELDPRCPPVINFGSEIAINTGDLTRAERAVSDGQRFDPLSSVSWLLASKLSLALGDPGKAQSQLDMARRLTEMYPPDFQDMSLIDSVQADIDANGGA